MNTPNVALSGALWNTYDPMFRFGQLGFRVVTIPEPTTGLLVSAGLVGLALYRRPRRELSAPPFRDIRPRS